MFVRCSVVGGSFLLPMLLAGAIGWAQETSALRKVEGCNVDLTKPGQMWDVLSNALILGFNQSEAKVFRFGQSQGEKFEAGRELAIAAAEEFGIEEAQLLAMIEKYRHCNCDHLGGGVEIDKQKEAGNNQTAAGEVEISKFAENVLTHVVLHEMAHGLVREFDLPVLANEETLADAFATHFLVSKLPDRALDVLEARISSWMIEANEVPRAEWSVQGEHNSDARRAYQVCAVAVAYDRQKYAPLATLVGMDSAKIKNAVDYGSEIHRSWRRMLKPLWMPTGQASSEARVIIEDDCRYAGAIANSELSSMIQRTLRSIDWHSQVTVRFVRGRGGASWSRSKRTIRVHDAYISRFNEQGRQKDVHAAK